jgi:hypothetical protein
VLSRTIYKKQRGRRLLTALATAGLVAGTFLAAGTVLAVHDLTFQLDGDVSASTTTTVGSSTQTLDWDSLFDSAGAEKALPAGFTATGFERDFQAKDGTGTCSDTGTGTFCTADHTTFATGSKDTLPITPGWQCNFDNNVNSKIDVMNAYAGAYTNPANSHEIVYFALERNTNTGDANVGFWFLQGTVGCVAASGSQAFSGDHVDGDLLIVSAFTKGGVVSTIDVYRWYGGANGFGIASDATHPNPVAHGADCTNTAAGDAVCATVNSPSDGNLGTITTPWLTSNFKDGTGHALRTAEFFEGGLDLTAKGLGGKCFNTFIGDTRSSQQTTATLFDYARGVLGECTATLTTEPSQSTRLISSTDAITDTATVVGASAGGGTGSTPTGTVDFFLCAPSELTPADTGTCEDPDGTAVTGNPVDLTETVPGTAEATSGDAQSLITGVGKYCFRAEFTGTGDYAGQTAGTDNATEECFTVTGSTSVTTDQNWVPNDSATITGDTALSGTATFDLFHSADCSGTSLYTASVAVSGTSPQIVSTSNTTTVVVVDGTSEGAYSWRVSYNDDVLADTASFCTETSNITITE